MTTRTQWDRNVADSHLNRSMFERLSFMWPREQPGGTIGVLSRPVVMGENPVDVERQGRAGIRRRFGENSIRYFCLLMVL